MKGKEGERREYVCDVTEKEGKGENLREELEIKE